MAHWEGEEATAKAAKEANTIYTFSSLATSKPEDIAKHGTRRWFQLYVLKDRNITREIVSNAEKHGYEALVLTIDTPILGRRVRDEKHGFSLPRGLQLELYAPFLAKKSELKESGSESNLSAFIKEQIDDSLTWKDVEWLHSITTLPVLVKGVMSKEDATLALKAGVKGIVVSNHGARQLDFVPATIQVLPEIVEAVRGKVPVFLDGGVRRGTDVLKALALGAKAVFVGRPVLYGLAYDGKEGVLQVLSILKDEFKRAMALSGCSNVSQIDSSLIWKGHSKL